MNRNLFESLNFDTISKTSAIIDLTDDIDDSDDEILIFPDLFSSEIGQILNDKNISAVLSNVEIFYKSQLEYLSNNRYDEEQLSNFIDLEEIEDDNEIKISEKDDLMEEIKKTDIVKKSTSKQTFSSYYFLKQTLNCPMVLIDHLIESLLDINVDDDVMLDQDYPQQIEIESGIDTDRSNVVTKKDLRLVSHFHATPTPVVKKPRTNFVGRGKYKRKLKSEIEKEIVKTEIIELIDSDHDMTEVNLSDDGCQIYEL